MLIDIVQATPLPNYHIHLRFEDGVEGEVDLAKLISFDGVFAQLKDPQRFNELRVNPELGTICWPNGADVDPDVLYAMVSGKNLPAFELPRCGNISR
jgi:hypothetical protein